MSNRTFIDTNIWVYAVDIADPAKQARALEVLEPSPDKDYIVSAQVLGEFYATVTGKLSQAVPASDASAMVQRMSELSVVPIDMSLVNEAIAGTDAWQLSYWDSLIIAAAQSSGCTRVLSEDMSHGAVYGAVRVENPFSVASADE